MAKKRRGPIKGLVGGQYKPLTDDQVQRIASGAEALWERPLVSFITSWMVSPLKFATDVTRLLIETCRQCVPVVLSAAPMAGSTAPVPLAGMLAQLTAEQLSGVVLTQLAHRGAPLLIGLKRTA
jgi:trimethylamine--corrinoid protein Co-methyltransferase